MAEKKLEVRLLTPAVRSTLSPYKYHNEEADMVILRTLSGDMGFLHGHVPCSVVLDAGIMRVIPGEGEEEIKLAVLGGAAQIEDNIVTVITEGAEWPEEIDKGRAITARDEQQAKLDASDDPEEREALRREIRTQEVRITVSGFPTSMYEKV